MQSVSAKNDLYLNRLKAAVLAVPAKAAYAAAKSAMSTAVSLTVQDSGQAAASWNISTSPGDVLDINDLPLSFAVGLKGEKRSATGATEIVIKAQEQEFSKRFPGYEALQSTEAVYLSNPVSGAHAANAKLVPAGQFARESASEAARLEVRGAFDAFNETGI